MSISKSKTAKSNKPAPKLTVTVPMISGKGGPGDARHARTEAKPAAANRAPIKTANTSKASSRSRSQRAGMSALDAAAKILTDSGKPLTCQEVVERAVKTGLWKTSGKTPAATVYSAIIREIARKGSASRFRKTERGHFTANKAAK
jgi:hypothetical protein